MTRLRRTHRADGRRLEASHVVDAPAADAWELLIDANRWPEWSPVVNAVESTDRRIREGTSGRVRVSGVWLPFRITDCEDRRWAWRVARLPTAAHRVDALEGDRCRIVFELPPQAVGLAPICLRALERLEDLLVEARDVGADR